MEDIKRKPITTVPSKQSVFEIPANELDVFSFSPKEDRYLIRETPISSDPDSERTKIAFRKIRGADEFKEKTRLSVANAVYIRRVDRERLKEIKDDYHVLAETLGTQVLTFSQFHQQIEECQGIYYLQDMGAPCNWGVFATGADHETSATTRKPLPAGMALGFYPGLLIPNDAGIDFPRQNILYSSVYPVKEGTGWSLISAGSPPGVNVTSLLAHAPTEKEINEDWDFSELPTDVGLTVETFKQYIATENIMAMCVKFPELEIPLIVSVLSKEVPPGGPILRNYGLAYFRMAKIKPVLIAKNGEILPPELFKYKCPKFLHFMAEGHEFYIKISYKLYIVVGVKLGRQQNYSLSIPATSNEHAVTGYLNLSTNDFVAWFLSYEQSEAEDAENPMVMEFNPTHGLQIKLDGVAERRDAKKGPKSTALSSTRHFPAVSFHKPPPALSLAGIPDAEERIKHYEAAAVKLSELIARNKDPVEARPDLVDWNCQLGEIYYIQSALKRNDGEALESAKKCFNTARKYLPDEMNDENEAVFERVAKGIEKCRESLEAHRPPSATSSF